MQERERERKRDKRTRSILVVICFQLLGSKLVVVKALML